MVWLLPGAGSARLIVILLITYIVALGGFSHIIAGSVEVLYLVLSGEQSFFSYLFDFALPLLLGNIVGGSALVAMLNHVPGASRGAGRRRGGVAPERLTLLRWRPRPLRRPLIDATDADAARALPCRR